MFEFENLQSLNNGSELFGSCLISKQMPFFAGHFEGRPMLPAAAQIMMIDALIQSFNAWSVRVKGGENIKFTQAVIPGDKININISKISEQRLLFTLKKQDQSLVSKGELKLIRNDFD